MELTEPILHARNDGPTFVEPLLHLWDGVSDREVGTVLQFYTFESPLSSPLDDFGKRGLYISDSFVWREVQHCENLGRVMECLAYEVVVLSRTIGHSLRIRVVLILPNKPW